MYMISSVKMRRAKREVEKTTPYFKALKEEIAELFLHIPETSNRYFRTTSKDAGSKHALLLVTSDKGLVGAYNQNAIALCEEFVAKRPGALLFIVGEYGRQYFSSKKIPFKEDFRYSAGLPTVWKARKICADILECYDGGEADEISIIYTDYIAGRQSVCKRNVLLPLEQSRFALTGEHRDTDEKEFLPSPDAVLSAIIPSYLTGFIYGCLVDSYCSEQQARMSAMSAAGDNADEMLRELRGQYNTVRQAAITREMTEIAAGSKALKKKRNKDRYKAEGDGFDRRQ